MHALLQKYNKADMPAAMHDVCTTLSVMQWQPPADAHALRALEEGKVLYLPQLPFTLLPEERGFLRPDCVKQGTKSIKYSLARDAVWGVSQAEAHPEILSGMLKRYAQSAQALVHALFPSYAHALVTGNSSFRPVEAEGRAQSWRHDDTLLHVDAFPSRPNGGQRILRVFTNIHPGAKPRVWRVGEPFANAAARFVPHIRPPAPGSAALLKMLKLTKSLRTPYDHTMLKMHDAMKRDADYQQNAPQARVEFAPGSSWIVFTDQVSHAAMSGCHALEQTFMLPVEAMHDAETSPLKVIARLRAAR